MGRAGPRHLGYVKNLSELYHAAHASVAKKQHAKYGNPVTSAPPCVPQVLERATRAGLISEDNSRKLAVKLGRKSYGEWGLTSGVVGAILDDVLGFGALHWTDKAKLEHDLSESF